jgi:hypothetical protein
MRHEIKVELAFDRSIEIADGEIALPSTLETLSVNVPRWSGAIRLDDPEHWEGEVGAADSANAVKALEAELRARPPYPGGSVELHGGTKDIVVTAWSSNEPLSRTGGKLLLDNSINITILTKVVEGKPASTLARLLLRELAARTSPVWGAVYSRDEYDEQVMQKSPSIRAVGRDFSRFLPGLFSANYFGSLYYNFIGASAFSALESSECAEVEVIAPGVMVNLYDPTIWASDECQARKRRALDILGSQYFFSKENGSSDTEAPEWPAGT